MEDLGIPGIFADENDRPAAEALAKELGTCVLSKAPTDAVFLLLGKNGLSLTDGKLEVRGDFRKLLPRLKTANLRQEMLLKAAKKKPSEETPRAVDATAGLGEDSLILAAAGFRVLLFEKDPIIAALLRDALKRAGEDPELSETVSRMEVRQEDSISALPCLPFTPDLVLLDPMFPERQKSASVKKKFQLLHYLEAPCSDESGLLDAALASGAHRILIKRPAKGAFLAGQKPSYSLQGKAIRYDVILQNP